MQDEEGHRLLYIIDICSHCLNADVKSALLLVNELRLDAEVKKDRAFVEEFTARFTFENDISISKKRRIADRRVIEMLLGYWRVALLNPSTNYDST